MNEALDAYELAKYGSFLLNQKEQEQRKQQEPSEKEPSERYFPEYGNTKECRLQPYFIKKM